MTAELTPYAPSSAPTPGRPLGLCPQSLDEALRLAEIMAKSDIVPKDFIGKPGNILVAIQWGAEIGLAPLQAMSHIAVINGRPALWGDALLAIVRGSGLLASFDEEIGADRATCTAQRRGEAPISRTFSREDAKQAGLLGKPGPWSQYPRRMMQMRARAWVLRDLFPDVIRGLHVAEEAQDLPVERAMGPAEVLPPGGGASRTAEVKARLARRQPVESTGTAAPAAVTPAETAEPVDQAEGGAEVPSLEGVLRLIQDAYTDQELADASEAAKRLAEEPDKRQARQAFKARREEIQRLAAEEARLEREAIQTEAREAA